MFCSVATTCQPTQSARAMLTMVIATSPVFLGIQGFLWISFSCLLFFAFPKIHLQINQCTKILVVKDKGSGGYLPLPWFIFQ